MKTNVNDIGLIYMERVIFHDNRGWFSPIPNIDELRQSHGLEFSIYQTNISYSHPYVVRGLHFQKPPHAQSKLITVLSGSIIDTVLDLRKSSAYFGKIFTFLLSSQKGETLFVPKGFAHGFLAIEENTIVQYHIDHPYHPESESGIKFDDPSLKFDWSDIRPPERIVSDKDDKLPYFENNPDLYFPDL